MDKDLVDPQNEDATIVLNLDDALKIQDAFDDYIENQWTPWSEQEKLRRFTIGMYEDLFSFQHQSTEQRFELVVGMGVLRWNKKGCNCQLPPNHQNRRAGSDPESKTITIYPTDRVPRPEIEYLQHFDISDISNHRSTCERPVIGYGNGN